MIGILLIFSFTVLSINNASPIQRSKNKSMSIIQKRFFPSKHDLNYSPTQSMKPQNRDFMAQVIQTAINRHHQKPDKWMDFYDNGAKWGHYVSPQIHHPSTTNIKDQHYSAKLNYNDPYDEGSRMAASQENHVEAYPGELVSGENSLSKFIAPPVFDEPDSAKDKIHEKIKEEHLVNTPEAVATETSNTKKLVDSLNSFMTPLRVPSDERSESESSNRHDQVGEQSNWSSQNYQPSERGQISDKQIKNIMDTEGRAPDGEPGTPQFESSLREMLHRDATVDHDPMNRQEVGGDRSNGQLNEREYNEREESLEHDHHSEEQEHFMDNDRNRNQDSNPDRYSENGRFRPRDHDEFNSRDYDDARLREDSEFQSRNGLNSDDHRDQNRYEHFSRNREPFVEDDNSREMHIRAREEVKERTREYERNRNEEEPMDQRGDRDMTPRQMETKQRPLNTFQDDHSLMKTIRNMVGGTESSYLTKATEEKPDKMELANTNFAQVKKKSKIS